MKYLLCLITGLLASLPVFASETDSAPMTYRYWDWSLTNSRDDYQIAALELALEKTRADYGPYRIVREAHAFTNARVVRELKNGELININAAPAYSANHRLTPFVNEISLAIDVPLMQGLLGYRQLIVQRNRLEEFRNIDEETLKQRVAGQGKAWEDVYIYRQNGYRVNDDGDYLALTNMLLAGRFDYLPMSLIEVHNVIAQAEDPSQLAIVENLIIYYPLPLYFYVSKSQPQLAERLEKGLRKAQDDGSLEKLLYEHFGKEIQLLKDPDNRVFTLRNEAVPEGLGLHLPQFISREARAK